MEPNQRICQVYFLIPCRKMVDFEVLNMLDSKKAQSERPSSCHDLTHFPQIMVKHLCSTPSKCCGHKENPVASSSRMIITRTAKMKGSKTSPNDREPSQVNVQNRGSHLLDAPQKWHHVVFPSFFCGVMNSTSKRRLKEKNMNLDATRMGHNHRIKNHLQGIAWVELRIILNQHRQLALIYRNS